MQKTRFSLRTLLLLAADAAMIAIEASVLSDAWRSSGTAMLRYYTQDSNVFALLVSCICALCTLYSLISGKKRPHFLKSLRLTAASGLMVTFLVAAFVLAPNNSGPHWKIYIVCLRQSMLDGSMLYLHTLCPLFMLFTFLFLEDRRPLPHTHSLLILLPTALYGTITLYNNYTRAYIGPYFFMRAYYQPLHETVLWCALILLGSWLISLAILEINRLIFRKHRNSSSA